MKKALVTGSLANSLEWYDFALYANFATILGKKFFPQYDTNAALLATLAVFAAGFVMRPIGAVFFGIIGDKYGRKKSLSLAVLMMSIPTVLVSILPAYETIGVLAPIILCLLRLIQGMSLGGALIGSASYIVEHSPAKYKSLAGSFSIFSLCVGFLLGSLVSFVISTNMSVENFEDYGWRIPFVFGFVTMGVSFYLSNFGDESPEFKQAKQEGLVLEKPLNKILKKYKLRVLHSISINALGSIGFYVFAVFFSNFLEVQRGFGVATSSSNEIYAMLIVMVSVLFSGFISDKIGKKNWYVFISIFTISIAYPAINFIEHGTTSQVFIAQLIFGFAVGGWIGPEPTLQISMYPTNVRSTGVSLSYNLGCAIFGGTAPMLCQYMFNITNNLSFLYYYISVAAIAGFISVILLNKQDIS
jgi:MHS family proline/betaine transporter-like MFS transporter